MKKQTLSRLLAIPGSRVTSPNGSLHVNGSPAHVPFGLPVTLEAGVLVAMPRVGIPLDLTDDTDILAFCRFVAPSLVDVFDKPSTLRKALGLKNPAGEYVTTVENGADGLTSHIVPTLKGMTKPDDWRQRVTAGVASGMLDALASGIPIEAGAADWAGALIEAVEA